MLRPRASLFVVSLVRSNDPRNLAVVAAGRLTSIIPRVPPTRGALRELLGDAGFENIRSLGGSSIAGFACRRAARRRPSSRS